jgi:HlyD family secretion protein
MKIQCRTVFWISAAVIVAAMLVYAFRPQAVPVDMTEAEVGPMVVAVRDEGRTRVRNEYVVSAPVSGQLLRDPPLPGRPPRRGCRSDRRESRRSPPRARPPGCAA